MTEANPATNGDDNPLSPNGDLHDRVTDGPLMDLHDKLVGAIEKQQGTSEPADTTGEVQSDEDVEAEMIRNSDEGEDI